MKGREGNRSEAGTWRNGPSYVLRHVLSVSAVIVIWELVVGVGLLPAGSFPTFREVFSALVLMLGQAAFFQQLGWTVLASSVGLLLATAVAVPLGVVLGLSSSAFHSARAIVEFLKPIPVVAILPLAILVLGITLQMEIALIVFGTIWPLLIQVMYGVRDTDPVLSETARAYRITRARWLAVFVLPSATPYIATGLRIAATTAIVLSVVTGLVAGGSGIGAALTSSQYAGDYPQMYALLLACGLLGLLINVVLGRFERSVMHWHPDHREDAK